MKRISWLAAILSGALVGAAVVVACSDDSPGAADAATCECAAAEPPLTGRIVRVRATGEIEPNVGGSAGAVCQPGAIILGGSCRLMEGNRNVFLTEAGIGNGGGMGYSCDWRSMSNSADTGVAEAICLMPAQ
jgi:hypothetical protein